MKTALRLFGIGCVLLASLIFFGFDLFGIQDRDIREDAYGWAWLGVALVAASALPWGRKASRWFDRDV